MDLTPLLGDGDTCPPEEEDLALLRFLRHNAWDVELTRAQVCGFFSFISIDCPTAAPVTSDSSLRGKSVKKRTTIRARGGGEGVLGAVVEDD